MEINSRTLGRITVDPCCLIDFQGGLPGFESIERYALIPHSGESPFLWLQAVDAPEPAFVVTDPRLYKRDYAPALPPKVLKELGAADPDKLAILAIISIPHDAPEQATANLMAPLVINPVTRRGTQVILHPSPYRHREPLFPSR